MQKALRQFQDALACAQQVQERLQECQRQARNQYRNGGYQHQT